MAVKTNDPDLAPNATPDGGGAARGSTAPADDRGTTPTSGGPSDDAAAARIAELQAQLEAERASVAKLKREAEIERTLRQAGAIDLETARLMVERELNSADHQGRNSREIIDELKSRKPFLFEEESSTAHSVASAPRAAMPARPIVERAAEQARTTGHRGDLMRYLRLRRSA